MIVANQNQPALLYRNRPDRTNHWIELALTGTRSNRSAFGAEVVVEYATTLRCLVAAILCAGYATLSIAGDRFYYMGYEIIQVIDGDTDTIVASVRAYVHALTKLRVKRARTAPAALSASA